MESNKRIKIDFEGGNLSSDGGLLLLKEFAHKMGIEDEIKRSFKTNDTAIRRTHKDDENLQQVIYQLYTAYFEDDRSDELTDDPVYTAILNKESLASQPTISRFYNRMDNDTLEQFDRINRELRRKVYSHEKPEMVLFDLDSTLLETYGNQEGHGYNFVYKANGYHPLVCYDGLTGDLLKSQLRQGSVYTSNGIRDFMQPLFDEYLSLYPETNLFLRGDSGFAVPELYTQCETNGTAYVIRLKENAVLREHAVWLDEMLYDLTKTNMVDYAVVYGEFYYQAKSWDYARRVVCKVEKPTNQLIHKHTFIVTNMEMAPKQIIRFYCNRGRMENMIKEGKNGFDFASVSSSSETVNANRFQIHALAYNIFNWFRRLALPKGFRRHTVDTVRLKLIKIAARVVRSARYISFKLCSHCPYKNVFYETLINIQRLKTVTL
jgi:hypothetical protein